MMNDGDIVEFAGTKFRVEVVSGTYTRIVPFDSDWLLRHITPKREDADTEDQLVQG